MRKETDYELWASKRPPPVNSLNSARFSNLWNERRDVFSKDILVPTNPYKPIEGTTKRSYFFVSRAQFGQACYNRIPIHFYI